MNERIYELDMRFGIVSAALAVLFLLSHQIVPCSAFYVPLSIEEMTEAADVILVGTVEEVLHLSAPKMYRQVTVSVERYLKNKLETETVTVVARGATVGNTTLWLSDQPEFQESERVLLFLRDDPSFLFENPQGFYEVVGLVQGKFIVGSDSAISDSGHVIEDGLRIGEIKFKLGERSIFENLVFPAAVALLSIGVISLFYLRRRVQGN